MKLNLSQIRDALMSQNYLASSEMLYALWASISQDRPLLLEGEPGVGKTTVARALADGLRLPYCRVQMYDGLTDDKILYDYDYQKQLLMLELLKPKLEQTLAGLSPRQAMQSANLAVDFYGPDFLIKRPILKAISGDGPCVLCIDEIDKAPEEVEYMLYEFLEDYALTIPQLGEIKCPANQKPLVFITSNGYRELSGALRRRCNYLYIERKSKQELTEILMKKAAAEPDLARGIAAALFELGQQAELLHYQPSIAEAIAYAKFLQANEQATKELAMNALSILVKDSRDLEPVSEILRKFGAGIWNGKGEVDDEWSEFLAR